MNIYLVLLNIAGAVTLLLWAVRMVRTGMERSYEHVLTRLMRDSKGGAIKAAAIGLVMAVVLQSATAVGVLAAGFAANGTLSVATGIAVMLGADLGSALVVLILSIDLHFVIPILLLVGGALFFRGNSRNLRQGGRVLIGIALILLSLRMIAEATGPLRENELLPVALNYLAGDAITAFIIGAAFTWLLHSSVASILLIVTFATHGVIPPALGISLVLGANMGGALIAHGLMRSGAVNSRRITLGNVLLRGGGAVVALALYQVFHPSLTFLGDSVARQVLIMHLSFNAILLVISIPLIRPMNALVTRLVSDKPVGDAPVPLAEAASCLDPKVIDAPNLALASATRELLRMAEIIERMLQPLMDIYKSGDPEKIRQARLMEAAVDKAQSDIKLYLAKVNYAKGSPEDERIGQDLATYAINLEYVGDAITKTLLHLAEVRRDQGLNFSAEGWRELNELHHQVLTNMRLAFNVLVSRDRESARQLMLEKDSMREAVGQSYNLHLKRLKTGSATSIASSNIHLETLRTLKTINSLFATIGYSILADTGDLLGSRLRDVSAE